MAPDLLPGPPPKTPRGTNFWLAYSGGLDSTVLLHALNAAGVPLRAVHVNHQLQGAAARWVEHCRESCRQMDVPLYVVDVKVDPRDPDGLEAAARRERYAALHSLMKPGDWLVTAHHMDDQAETVLLRLMRGSGVLGLSAMRESLPLGEGRLWRPLLRRARAELQAYAERHKLSWVEDPHNRDPRFSRTVVRHELFPLMAQRWPKAVEMITRSAAHCAEATELLNQLAAQDFRRVSLPPRRGGGGKPGGECLSVRKLLALPVASRNNVLRFWAERCGREAPTFEALQRIEAEVLRARQDASPVLAWGGSEVRRYRDQLYLMERLAPPPVEVQLEWDGQQDLALPPGCGRLVVRKAAKPALSLCVSFGQGGERIKPVGSRKTRTLRNLFQEAAMPGWLRERTPLLTIEGELVAVGDCWRTAPFAARCRRTSFRFAWSHAIPG